MEALKKPVDTQTVSAVDRINEGGQTAVSKPRKSRRKKPKNATANPKVSPEFLDLVFVSRLFVNRLRIDFLFHGAVQYSLCHRFLFLYPVESGLYATY